MTALFSGRFDRVHVGHIISLQRLAERYKKVLVVVLDYEGQQYSVQYREQMLKECLGYCKGNFEILVNKDHFGKISKENAAGFGFDVYCSGNQQCLKHMEELGYRVEYVERAYDYEATDDRKWQQIKEVLR
jgi:nicotinamide mononucleotide adenylyltransferase